MQMVQWEGGESVKEDDCGGKEWCIVLRREKRKINVLLFIVMCVLLLAYLTRVLL